jgi:hypothetical protein
MGTTLDVAIGLVSVYLLLSVLCSAVYEALAGVFRLRAVNLARSIETLLEDGALDPHVTKALARMPKARGALVGAVAFARARLKLAPAPPRCPLALALRQHPLIKTLTYGRVGPSYIPSHTFVAALVDTLRQIDWPSRGETASEAPAPTPAPADKADPLGELKSVVDRLPPGSELKRALSLVIDGTGKDVGPPSARIERWFNDAMDRAAGRYKRHSQVLISAAALTLCAGFNADTVAIANALARDSAVRAAMLTAAEVLVKSPPPGAAPAPAGSAAPPREDVLAAAVQGGAAVQQLTSLELHIAWGGFEVPRQTSWPRLWGALGWLLGAANADWLRGLLARIFSPGVLITTAAASLGAPFWFDLLNKLVNLRTAGRSPEPSRQGSS